MLKKLFVVIAILSIMVAVPALADVNQDGIGNTQAGANVEDVSASVEQNYGDSYSRVGMPIAPQMTYPGLPSYFGPAPRDSNFMPVSVITMFKKTFTRSEIEALLSSNQGLSRLKSRVNVFTGTIPKDERQADDTITVRLIKPEGNYAPVGYITSYSKSTERDSVDVFYNALEEAINTLECEEVLVVGEGVMNVLKTWGAGVGFYYNHAFLKDGNNSGDASGGAGGGGTGISWGEAGYRTKAHMQFILLNNLDVPTRHKVQ